MTVKSVVTISFIITQLSKLEWGKHCWQNCEKIFLKFENIDFLTYFSSKGRHVTHEVRVPHRALHKCVVGIGNLYGWKGHRDNFLHNNSTLKDGMG